MTHSLVLTFNCTVPFEAPGVLANVSGSVSPGRATWYLKVPYYVLIVPQWESNSFL